MCHVFNLTVDIENPFYRLEDVHQTIFLAKFQRNQTSAGRVDSIFWSADSLPLKLNKLPPVTSNFHETLCGGSTGEYLEIH